MAITVKSGWATAVLHACVNDGSVLVDADSSSSDPTDDGVSFGTGDWGPHFRTTGSGGFTPYGADYVGAGTLPDIDPDTNGVTAVGWFNALNSLSTTLVQFVYSNFALQACFNSGALAVRTGSTTHVTGSTTLPTDGTAFMVAWQYKDGTSGGAIAKVWYGEYGDSLASDGSVANPGNWASTDKLDYIGGRPGGNWAGADVAALVILDGLTSDSDLADMHANGPSHVLDGYSAAASASRNNNLQLLGVG